MRPSRKALFAGIIASGSLLAFAAHAQQPAAQPPAAPNHPGKDLLLGKCAQCHTDSIWRDQRQDARAWEATLYRMMGRGAVWSGEEIKTMAEFLAIDFGANVPRAKPAAR